MGTNKVCCFFTHGVDVSPKTLLVRLWIHLLYPTCRLFVV